MRKNVNVSIIAIFLLCSAAKGQLGTNAGALVTYMNVKEGNLKKEFPQRSGWTFGIMYKASIKDNFAIQPEINFTQKGGQYSPPELDEIVLLDYLEIPVYFLYQESRMKGFFGGIAPTFNLGLRGTHTLIMRGTKEKRDIQWGNAEDDEIKKTHWAINAQAGYRFNNGLALNGFFTQSITNSAPHEGTKIDFLSFGARVSYFFIEQGESHGKKQKVIL